MTDWREEWQNADKVYVLVTLGFIAAALFMGFQIMEQRSDLNQKGCRYYYERHVPGFNMSPNGEFMNSTEYRQAQEARKERIEDHKNPPGPLESSE